MSRLAIKIIYMSTENNKYIISWSEYQEKCQKLTQEILQSDFKPTAIICLVRGGFYVGDYVSRKLNVPLSCMLTRSYKKGAGEQNASGVNIADMVLTLDELGTNILLVDDLVDRGDTMHETIKWIKNKYPNVNIKTAVVFQKPNSTFLTDFVAEKMTEQKWIVQPFEVEE
jgi:hypoxanthine phosphoribosyltransferase